MISLTSLLAWFRWGAAMQLDDIEQKLDDIEQTLQTLVTKDEFMAAIDDLKTNFEALKTEVGVIGDDMDALKAKLDAALAAAGVNNDPAIEEVALGMADLTTRLKAVVDRDMPPPVPAPVP